jgi:hypothetical protein
MSKKYKVGVIQVRCVRRNCNKKANFDEELYVCEILYKN